MSNHEDIKIFILSGGFGTRLKSIIKDIPKVMADINGKPFLCYQIDEIRKYFPRNDIYLLTHYLSDFIEEYFKSSENIRCIREQIPLGTGGSIKNAIKNLGLSERSQILVFNGDTYIKPDLIDFIKKTSGDVSIVTCDISNTSRFNTLEIKDNKLIKFLPKNSNKATKHINSGCYYFRNLSCLNDTEHNVFSIEDQFQKYLKNKIINTYSYDGIFVDIGIPEDYIRCKNLI